MICPGITKTWRLVCAGTALSLCGALARPATDQPRTLDHHASMFHGWHEFRSWDRTAGAHPGEEVWTSPVVKVPGSWDELIASWNVQTPPGSGLHIEARAGHADAWTRYYSLGFWSADPKQHRRASVSGQSDADAEVQTDTLALKRPAETAQLRVTMTASPEGARPVLTFIGLCCLNTRTKPQPLPPNRRAWGRSIEVPERSQANYPGGAQAWCSPTSVSMVLAYWARQLGKPGLDRDVPEVVEGVYDPSWPGTGNWSFNAAYAGSLPGLRAYVTRLTDLSELEDWVMREVPVVVSVCYDLLRGRPRNRDSGHLVVCVGFTEEGDVIVNDPGTRTGVRKTFPRENLARAWANSKNTVYLIHPEGWRPPRDRFGHWHATR